MQREKALGKNLKYFREKKGFTQKQLAEMIGYTEKSISKWENGTGLPTLETLIELSLIFGVSLDEFVCQRNQGTYFLGIDGGGTKTRFKLIDQNGEVVSEICKGSSNPNDIGMENTKALLKEGILEVCKGIPFSEITMFAGLSGGGLSGNNLQILKRFFADFGFFAFGNGSDIDNLVTLADKEKSVLVIMGTGFMVYALNGKEKFRISGWGQYFDNGGSGYTIGRDVITAVLSHEDQSGEPTLLTELLHKKIGETADKHLTRFYDGGKRYIANFSALAFDAAKQGDKIAAKIIEDNMQFVAQKISAAIKRLKENPNEKISVLFSGGLSNDGEILFPLIEKHLRENDCELRQIKGEPVDGAVKYAKNIYLEKTKGDF